MGRAERLNRERRRLEAELNRRLSQPLPQKYPQQHHAISSGTTSSERLLTALAKRTFLTFWSYANLYRSPGHELCDLFVAFGDDAVIFSDKDCVFPADPHAELSWKRWFKRAIHKSAQQLVGAERWVRQYPDRIFLDAACQRPIPLRIPNPARLKCHLVLVAHGAVSACRAVVGKHGRLSIAPRIVGDASPFVIGQILPSGSTVHVLDDVSLPIVLDTLDTVRDFVAYLARKEALLADRRLVCAASEEDLLGDYLANIDEEGERAFSGGKLRVMSGGWAAFAGSPERRRKWNADRISYAWDDVIERFIRHYLAGTSDFLSTPEPTQQEVMFRFLARESRLRRRMLAETLVDMIQRTGPGTWRKRIVLPSEPGDPHWVFVVLPRLDDQDDATYRDVRRMMLHDCCVVAKLVYPEAMDIMGLALSTKQDVGNSEDLLYYDARIWTETDRQKAREIQLRTGIFTKMRMLGVLAHDYPE